MHPYLVFKRFKKNPKQLILLTVVCKRATQIMVLNGTII